MKMIVAISVLCLSMVSIQSEAGCLRGAAKAAVRAPALAMKVLGRARRVERRAARADAMVSASY